MKVYLAGPEVFFPDGKEILARKRALALEAGFAPVGPGSGTPVPEDPAGLGVAIYRVNAAAIADADFCIANLSPFRGTSADAGTVWEVGCMTGQGKPVFGYTVDPRDYIARIIDWAGEHPVAAPDGELRLSDGMLVEDCGMADNLMIEGAMAVAGTSMTRGQPGEDPLQTFHRCLQAAVAHMTARAAT